MKMTDLAERDQDGEAKREVRVFHWSVLSAFLAGLGSTTGMNNFLENSHSKEGNQAT